MKKFNILVVVLVSIFVFSCKEKNQKETVSADVLTTKIEVIDFHSTNRCMTCNAIEANTIYTLETYFPEQLANKSITFQTINVDLDENYAMAEKFEATGTSLFLNVIVDGKETPIDLTNFAFMNGTDQEAFSAELKSKIEEELEKL
jgi:hypothetical protein